MKIPKIIIKNNKKYIFVEKCNEKLYLYKEMEIGYKECFTAYDLGMIKKKIEEKKRKYNLSPEKVKFL